MIEHMNEYDFYMQYEDDILNGSMGVIAFTIEGCVNCAVVINKLEALSETIDIPMAIIDINENEIMADSMNVNLSPTVLIFYKGEEYKRFEEDFNVDDMIEDILELQKSC